MDLAAQLGQLRLPEGGGGAGEGVRGGDIQIRY